MLSLTFIFIILVPIICTITGQSDDIIIDTSSGYVKGKLEETKWGSVVEFLSIPYAELPERFQNSKPILYKESLTILQTNNNDNNEIPNPKHKYHHHYNPKLDNIKYSTTMPSIIKFGNISNDNISISEEEEEASSSIHLQQQQVFINQYEGMCNACPQPTHLRDFKHPSVPHSEESLNEDCLKLNIYAPVQITSFEKGMVFPIMVWIPGDGFSFGDAIHYDGTLLAARGNMIVITINYRVGVFGFLSTGNELVPGNAGLSDIISALQWIQENGKKFHGDVANITLSGRFSGSMAISMLMTSPAFTKTLDKSIPRLAKRIILHGGIASSPWVIETNPIEPALKLIGLTDCKTNRTVILMESLECLKNLSVKDILDASMKVPEMFRPVVDNRIIIRDPMESIYYGIIPDDVDFLIGDNTGSGSLCYQRHVYTKGNILPKIQGDFVNEDDLRSLIQDDLIAYFNIDDEGLAAMVTHEYLYSCNPNKNLSYRDIYTHFCGMLFLRNPTESTAGYISRLGRNRVFRYEVDGQFEGDASSVSPVTPKWLETSIGNEIIYLFPTKDHNMSKFEDTFSMNMTDAYINFVRSGHPGKDWLMFNEETKNMITFTANGLQKSTSFYLQRDVHFWRDSFPKLITSFKKLAELNNNKTGIKCIEVINKRNDDNFEKQCMESIEHHQSFTSIITIFFLVFLILLGLIALALFGLYVYKMFKANRFMC